MAKKTNETKETKEAEVPEVEKKSSKGFTVLDSNGKQVRTAKTREEANELAKVYGGRVA